MLVLGLALTFLVYCRLNYHDFSWWGSPPRMSCCGRTFIRLDPARPGPRSSVPTVALVAVSAVPPFFRNVYAVDPHPAPVGGACTMELYYAVSPGKLVAYGLSGGP